MQETGERTTFLLALMCGIKLGTSVGKTQGRYEVVKLQSDARHLVGSFERWTLLVDGQHGCSGGYSELSLSFSQLCRSQHLPGRHIRPQWHQVAKGQDSSSWGEAAVAVCFALSVKHERHFLVVKCLT